MDGANDFNELANSGLFLQLWRRAHRDRAVLPSRTSQHQSTYVSTGSGVLELGEATMGRDGMQRMTTGCLEKV